MRQLLVEGDPNTERAIQTSATVPTYWTSLLCVYDLSVWHQMFRQIKEARLHHLKSSAWLRQGSNNQSTKHVEMPDSFGYQDGHWQTRHKKRTWGSGVASLDIQTIANLLLLYLHREPLPINAVQETFLNDFIFVYSFSCHDLLYQCRKYQLWTNIKKV